MTVKSLYRPLTITLLLIAALLTAWPAGAGELAAKAARFDKLVATQHIPHGMLVNLRVEDGDGTVRYRSFGDSTIWTGAYIASQIYRYRLTWDEEALSNVEKCLRAFVQLHEMAGSRGFIGRAFGSREELGNGREVIAGIGSYSHLFFKADTSRDQYTGIFMGCGLAWHHIRDDKLRAGIRTMISAAARNLMANNLSLKTSINGFVPSTFDLNPDYAYQDRINPEEWAKVDDFPANVFAAWVPYSDRLARILGRFRPPAVRGGEALRALLMFQTACNITADQQLHSFFKDELLEKRQLHVIASDTSQLLTDIYLGRNLAVVENRVYGVLSAIGRVAMQVMAIQAGMPESLSIWAEPVFTLPVALVAGNSASLLLNTLAAIREPGAFAVFDLLAAQLHGMAANLRFLGAAKAAEKLEKRAAVLKGYAASNIDEFSDTMRSYVGCNLGFFALLGILDQQGDPHLRQAALAILPRALEPIADEGNSMYNLIEGAFTDRDYNDPLIVAARRTLQLYPENCLNRHFDHSATMKHSPWPDRFGRHDRQSIEVIPIDQRAPHIFIWQEPPRMLVTGADDQVQVAPAGYLLAYWFGRYHGLIRETD